MNASEIRLHAIEMDTPSGENCHWCGATLLEGDRHRRIEPRYAIDGGRRVLVEVELSACADCCGQAETLTEADRVGLQRRLDEMPPPQIGQCEVCDSFGELFPHFDQDEGDEFLLCERCFFEAP